jgi:hypothetical protein
MTVGEEYGEVVSACHRYTASVSKGRPVGYHGKVVRLAEVRLWHNLYEASVVRGDPVDAAVCPPPRHQTICGSCPAPATVLCVVPLPLFEGLYHF